MPGSDTPRSEGGTPRSEGGTPRFHMPKMPKVSMPTRRGSAGKTDNRGSTSGQATPAEPLPSPVSLPPPSKPSASGSGSAPPPPRSVTPPPAPKPQLSEAAAAGIATKPDEGKKVAAPAAKKQASKQGGGEKKGFFSGGVGGMMSGAKNVVMKAHPKSIVSGAKQRLYKSIQSKVGKELVKVYTTKIKTSLTGDRRMPWVLRKAIHEIVDEVWGGVQARPPGPRPPQRRRCASLLPARPPEPAGTHPPPRARRSSRWSARSTR